MESFTRFVLPLFSCCAAFVWAFLVLLGNACVMLAQRRIQLVEAPLRARVAVMSFARKSSNQLLSLRAFRPGRTVLRFVIEGLHAWVNQSCTVGRLMPAVTKIASYQQDGADASLALLMVWMMVALKRDQGYDASDRASGNAHDRDMSTRSCGSTEE